MMLAHARRRRGKGIRFALPCKPIDETPVVHGGRCAVLALATVLRFWGRPGRPDSIQHKIGTGEGVRFAALVDYLRFRRLHVAVFRGTLPLVKDILMRGVPCVMDAHVHGEGHVRTAVGFDELLGTVVFAEPGMPVPVDVPERVIAREWVFDGDRTVAAVPASLRGCLSGLPDGTGTLGTDDLHHCVRSERELDAGNLPQARSELVLAMMHLDPDDRHEVSRAGIRMKIHLAEGRTGQAEVLARRLCRRHPKDAHAALLLGDVLAAANRPFPAARAYARASRLNRSDPRAAFFAGAAFFAAGRLSRAEHAARRTLRLDPRLHQAHVILGRIAERRRKFKSAVTHFSRAAALRPDDSRALADLANSHMMLGNSDASERFFRRSLDLDARQPWAMMRFGALLLECSREGNRSQRLDEAANVLTQALKSAQSSRHPDLPGIHLVLGKILLEQGKIARGGKHLRAARSLSNRQNRKPGSPSRTSIRRVRQEAEKSLLNTGKRRWAR